MASINLQTWATLTATAITQAQASCSSLINFAVGSRFRALMESAASLSLWLQYQILQVVQLTRLATSNGTDVDSWVGDFGLTRLAATASTGTVTMTSLNPSSQSAVIPNGALVRTADGSVTFAVYGGPYTRPAGTASVAVQVQCTTTGTVGNVASGLITLLGSSISGIDTCSNPAAFVNAQAAETDAALRARFVLYISTRQEGTLAALAEAIASVQSGIFYQIVVGVSGSGAAQLANVLTYVDDGTGNPPQTLLTAIDNAIATAISVGISHQTIPAIDLPAVVTMTITVSDGTDLTSEVNAAIVAYLDSLSVGVSASFTRMVSAAYQVDTRITNITGATLNGGTSDIGGTSGTVVRPSSITVSHT